MTNATLTIRTHSRKESHTRSLPVALPATVVLEVDIAGAKRRLLVDLDRYGGMDLSQPVPRDDITP